MSEVPRIDASRRAFLGLRTPVKPQSLRATIADSCLNLHRVICDACKDICSTRAIQRVWTSNRAPALAVDADLCTGCGDCADVCPAGAIAINTASQPNE